MSAITLGSDAARAVGIFREEGPLGYVASTAPGAKLRPTRALAEADERRHRAGALTHGALFAGYDGIGLALESLFPGTELAWYSEFDAAPSRVMAHNYPDAPNLGDVTRVDWASTPRVDILTGGFPCQDLSLAGRRAGMRDGTRSGLWADFLTAIDVLRPQLVVIENVRGLLSACAESDLESCPGCVGDADHRPVLRALGRVLGDLAGIGFDAEWGGLEASAIGAPHRRFREFIVAWPATSDGRLFRDLAGRQLETARVETIAAGSRGPLFPTPDASVANDGEGPESWFARRERVRATGINGNGMGMPLTIAVQTLPTPTAADAEASGGSTESNRTLTDVAVRGKGPLKLLRSPVADEDGGGPLHPDVARERGQTLRLTGQILAMTGDLLPTPSVADTQGGRKTRSGERNDELLLNGIAAEGKFGEFQEAIDRWAAVLGRDAPDPTIAHPKSGKAQLSPLLTEWMMGLPLGRVTDPAIWADSDMSAPAIRTAQLKLCGNGVVPQQAAFAVASLMLRAHYSRPEWGVAA